MKQRFDHPSFNPGSQFKQLQILTRKRFLNFELEKFKNMPNITLKKIVTLCVN